MLRVFACHSQGLSLSFSVAKIGRREEGEGKGREETHPTIGKSTDTYLSIFAIYQELQQWLNAIETWLFGGEGVRKRHRFHTDFLFVPFFLVLFVSGHFQVIYLSHLFLLWELVLSGMVVVA